MNFSREEALRYGRHLSLAGFGPERQDRLRKASVLVIGAGGLGCPSLLYLAAAGVGRIVLVDFDTVDASNLQRQVLFVTEDVGQPKAIAAARRLRALNPLIAIEPRAERFARSNARELVRGADLVVDGSDNFSTRYLVNDACVLEDRPYVYGAIQGFEGQASVFNWRGGPTYRCLFPEPPEPGTVPNCAEAGVLGVLPGLVGLVQATEAIKILAGIGEPLSGRLWLYDALAMRTQIVALAADPRSRAIRQLPPEGYGEVCAVPHVRSAASASSVGPDNAAWSRADTVGAAAVPSGALGKDWGLDGSMEIDVPELREAMEGGRPLQLIDVREDWERILGSIEPSAHIPLGRLMRGGAEVELARLDSTRPVVLYCAVGARSLQAAKVLRERYRFPAAVSLRGGYGAWIR